MTEADRRNIEHWKALKGNPEPWIAAGNSVFVARQAVIHYSDHDFQCFRPDGRPNMEANPKRLVGVCEDYGEADGIANRHNAAIGHWLFDDWLEGIIKAATESTS